MTTRTFSPRGMLALEPRAFGMFLGPDPFEPYTAEVDDVQVVGVRGPLMHHPDPYCDSYDSIKERVAVALQSSCKAVVLSIDSPGGLVSGCFDTVVELREMAAAARKPLIAFIDGQATSAAYALACACSAIYSTASAMVGSIGVIDALLDVTAQDAAFGVRMALVTSGARKADGNPHVPIDEARIAAAQRNVDALAGMFFELVSGARALAPEAVQALEAGLCPGAVAQGLGLVDGVTTFDALIATVATGQITTPAGASQDNPTMAANPYEEAVASLRKAAEGDDANAKAAKRALAALEANDDEPGDDEPAASDEPADDDEPAARAQDDDEPAAAAAAPAAEACAAAPTSTIDAGELVQRAALLASRPDLSDEVRAELASLPLAAAKKLVAAIPKATSPARAAIAAATGAAAPTTGNGGAPAAPATQRVEGASYNSPHAADLDRQMGLTTQSRGARAEGNLLVLSAVGAKKGK